MRREGREGGREGVRELTSNYNTITDVARRNNMGLNISTFLQMVKVLKLISV